MKKLRILALMHEDLVPPDSLKGLEPKDYQDCITEYNVMIGLKNLGHQAQKLGVASDLGMIRKAIEEFKPHIAFNLLEEFHGVALYDQHVVSYLELMKKPYTGCNPRGLTLAHDKSLSKKILAYHRIPVPVFAVMPIGRKVKLPKKLQFPLFVKSATEEGSVGISQASIVTNQEKLMERVEFIHANIGTDAIVEQYIDGRELYVGILGNLQLKTFPIWELWFTKLPEGSAKIATSKVKWDENYQKKVGLKTGPASNLPNGLEDRILKLCRRAYKALGISGYARMDLRLTESGEVYLIEVNPNPDLGFGQEFSDSAKHIGIKYEDLLQKVINLGLRYKAHWKV